MEYDGESNMSNMPRTSAARPSRPGVCRVHWRAVAGIWRGEAAADAALAIAAFRRRSAVALRTSGIELSAARSMASPVAVIEPV